MDPFQFVVRIHMNVFVSYDKDAYDDSGPGAPPSPEKQRFVSGGHIQPNGKASTPDTTSTKSITVDHVKSKPINYKKHQLVSSHSFKKKPHTPLRHSSDHFESTASRSALNSSGKSGERQIDQIRRSMERQRDDPQEISVYSISVEVCNHQYPRTHSRRPNWKTCIHTLANMVSFEHSSCTAPHQQRIRSATLNMIHVPA